MKTTKKYYFTVEGETEHWYLKWLENEINNRDESLYKVSIDCPVQKNPVKRAKSLTLTSKIDIYHLADYESDEPVHVDGFIKTMDNLKAACSLGRQINYKFGYSNLTFDLWIVLHKIDLNSSINHRKDYISAINKAYSEHFLDMDEFKHEKNFKRCLKKLDLSNVVDAVERGKLIMKRNNDNGCKLYEYKKYEYFKENPSLLVWEPIEKILKDCELY